MRRISLLLLAFTLVLVPAANANLLVNGSFEQGTPTGAFTTLHLNSTAITGWTVTDENIDIVGTYWQQKSGTRSIDLDGTVNGCLSQTFATVPGQAYAVTFWLAGNPGGSVATKTMFMRAALDSVPFSFTTTGHTTANMGWIQQGFSFIATGATTTLDMCGTGLNDGWGCAIDDVVVDVALPTARSTWGRIKTIYRP